MQDCGSLARCRRAQPAVGHPDLPGSGGASAGGVQQSLLGGARERGVPPLGVDHDAGRVDGPAAWEPERQGGSRDAGDDRLDGGLAGRQRISTELLDGIADGRREEVGLQAATAQGPVLEGGLRGRDSVPRRGLGGTHSTREDTY